MLTRLLKNKKAFTLIELMIVVIIIGVLAALAIPRFMRTSTQAKQSEAKKILKQIYICQRTFRQEKDTYTCNGQNASAGGGFPQIWIEIMQNSRYTYSIVADSNSFTATASGNIDDDVTLDTWTIDEDGDLQCTSNDAAS
ncbi:MAG: hypothetical protein AMJ90_09080 [candidate division Zixibacteria bacterium SM23_73_2]|nr:MAG: hypothetical protein AMJ90_09080 [candidate division Zixibacteria bacterium SM23_73_2]